MRHAKSQRPVSARGTPAAAFEPLEVRRLMSAYNFTVEVDPYAVGITSGHNSGTGSLATTNVTVTASAPPTLEEVLRAALTQAGVTLSARHTATLNGTYDGSGPSGSNRLVFLAAEDTGQNHAGTTSHEQSLAAAKGLSGGYVVAFEDGTDFDYNDGYFLVNIASV